MSGAVAAVEVDPPAPAAAPPAAAAPTSTPDTSLLSNPDADKPASVEGEAKPAEAGAGEASLLSGDPDKPKTDADGAKADAKPEAAPETYQFTVPEGMALDETLVAKATPLFKELGLNQDGAQKLVSLYADQIKAQTEAASAANVKAFTDMVTGWKSQSKIDAEFGGDKLAENLGAAKAFVMRFDPAGDMLKELDTFGLSNNPAVLRFLVRASKTISEDKSISRGDGAAQQTPKKPYDIMWPPQTKE